MILSLSMLTNLKSQFRSTFFTFLCSFVFLLFACNSNHTETSSSSRKTVFRYNEPGGISSLDPAFARNVENVWVTNQLFNGLVQMDEKLEVIPCIAYKWEVSDDGLVYTFHLRNDVYFHDSPVFEGSIGRQVTAHDFVYSFSRILSEEIASPGSWIFNYLDKSSENNYLGFLAKDERTFKVYLKKPFPPFLGILTMQYCTVVPKEAVDYFGNDFRRNPVGTGPFKFKIWEEGTKLVLVKNNNYFEKDEFGKALPYIDAVAVSFVRDQQVSFLDFVRGSYEFMSGLEGNFKDEIFTKEGNLYPKYEGKFLVQKHSYLKTDYIGILVDHNNDLVKNSPLKIKAIRQAINYGFDRKKMVKYLRNSIGIPASSGMIPIGMPAFDDKLIKGYNYNPEKSRELLYVAGFPDGKGLPPITLTTTIDYQNLGEYIQRELLTVGINVNIEVVEEASYREMVAQSKLTMFKKSWIADYPDSENFLALFFQQY